jgi:predicted nucleic acid-binding protein
VNVLVDISIWSLALRRKHGSTKRAERAIVLELTDLIGADRVVIVGPIRQEILSGVRSDAEFDRLSERLAEFEDEPLLTADYEEAARCHNRCRGAAAIRRALALFTTDSDFEQFSQKLPLTLHRLATKR